MIFEKIIKILSTTHSPICIMCGHFALIADNEDVLPAIYTDIVNADKAAAVKANPYMGLVPNETFMMGAKIAAHTNAHIALLVNDWQNIPKVYRGHKVNTYRDLFYKNSTVLPKTFQAIADTHGIERNRFVIPPKDFSYNGNPLFFSETLLRKRFDSKEFSFAACSLKHGCAQEYLPFVKAIADRGYKTLVSFIPIQCQVPVMQATAYALETAEYDINIISVYVNGSNESSEEFWSNARMYVN